MGEEDIQFEDGSEGRFGGHKKEELTFELIVLRHLTKITSMSCVEYRGGYWQQKTKMGKDGNSSTEKIYTPDTREQIGNAIDMLYDLLLPIIEQKNLPKDKGKTKENIDEIYGKINLLRKKCIEKTETKEEDILGTEIEDTMILPAESYKGNDKQVLELYKNMKLKLTREIFQNLMRFVNTEWNWGVTNPLII